MEDFIFGYVIRKCVFMNGIIRARQLIATVLLSPHLATMNIYISHVLILLLLNVD